MHDVSTLEEQFVEALPHVRAVLRHVACRYRLSWDESDELESRVRLRLIEDDYRVFRLFEGRSQLRTYLTTVVTRLVLDERVKAWGKWRPSTEARRLGPLAVTLEKLITRDHMPAEEAIETLCSRDTSLQESTLRTLLERLPARSASRRHVDEAELSELPAAGPGSDSLVVAAEASARWQAARAALANILSALPARDRLLIELRYVQGSRVSEIARVVREDQKALYRRYDQLLRSLRQELEGRGVSRQVIGDFFLDGVPDGEDAEAPQLGPSGSVSDDAPAGPDQVAG